MICVVYCVDGNCTHFTHTSPQTQSKPYYNSIKSVVILYPIENYSLGAINYSTASIVLYGRLSLNQLTYK